MTEPALQTLASVLHLGRLARQADDLASLGFVLVNETRQVLPCRQAALWRAPMDPLSDLAGQGVAAVSGLPTPETDAPYTQWLTRLFRHVLLTPPQGPVAIAAGHFPDGLSRDWGDWLPEHGLMIPLISQGKCHGALLLAREHPWLEGEIALADELGGIYAHALAAFAPRQSWRDWLREKLPADRKRMKQVGLGVALVCLLPLRLSVLAPAEVTPLDPFVVRAPLDGTVDRFRIRPSQAVKEGDVLFDMDAIAARSRQEVARSSFDAAAEEYRQAAQLALTEEKGKQDLASRQARLEEKRAEFEYSRDLLARVQVKAPRAGVAVFSDENEWQGKAVVVGERVLTLAEPGKVELTIYLPVADAIELKPDSNVVFYPDGSVFGSHDGALTSLAYRAEPTQDGILAYRLKARLAPGEAPPRIGAVGTAKVYGNRAPLIYHILRRPLVALRQTLGV